jgi:hypothetical protein
MSTDASWYYAQGSQSLGPMSLQELVARLPSAGGERALVFGPGVADWSEARHVAVVVEALRGGASPPPPPASRRSDEIDYEIFGQEIGVGLFGGEGFIMQRLTGDGIAMVHAGGTLMHRRLEPREVLKLDTGCLVALTPSVNYDIQLVGGIKNTLFGGEGLIFATLTGPGDVWLQSLPFSRLAGRIFAAAPARGGKEEGSILGGLGRMLDGD